MDELLKAPELSKTLGVPEGTLQDWRYRGIGPRYLKIGKHVRYRAIDVEAWLDAQTVVTA